MVLLVKYGVNVGYGLVNIIRGINFYIYGLQIIYA